MHLQSTKYSNTQKQALGWYHQIQIQTKLDRPIYKINDTAKNWVILYGTNKGWEVII